MKLSVVFFLFLVTLLSACREQGIQTYTVPKETASVASISPDKTKLQWVAPKSWTAIPPSSLRLGSFTAASGQVDISIVGLGGKAGGLLANVNRWRGQLGLKPTTLSKLKSELKKQQYGTLSFTVVTLNSKEKAMRVAILENKDQNYFIKMMGPKLAVKNETKTFEDFLRTIQF